jgi:hypothetical protein
VTTATTTNLTGLLKGSGGNVAQAAAGTDYLAPTGSLDAGKLVNALPAISGAALVYDQLPITASSMTLNINNYGGGTLIAPSTSTINITNVVVGKYFDFKVFSTGGGMMTISSLTPTWVSGTPATIQAGKASWFVCKGIGTNTADCAAIKENY